MAGGFFVIWRSLMDSPIWRQADACQQSILINLLSRVVWKDTPWEINGKVTILKPGQIFTSVAEIVNICPKEATPRKVRTALQRFSKFGFLTIETTKGGAHAGSLISIVNWAKYQSINTNAASQTTNEMAIRRQASDKPATNERQASDKAIKEPYNQVTMEQGNQGTICVSAKAQTHKARPADPAMVAEYFNERACHFDHREEAEKFWDFYESNGWKVGKNPMKDWKAAARNWASNVGKYRDAGRSASGAGYRGAGRSGGLTTAQAAEVFARENARRGNDGGSDRAPAGDLGDVLGF